MKKKMAIVSSFAESCGNATFTKIIRDSIHQYYGDVEVEAIELNLKILQSIEPSIRKKADAHIKDICARLKKFDSVNLQIEAGLYGTLPKDITSRIESLICAHPNTSITMHSPRLIGLGNYDMRAGIKSLLMLKLKTGVKQILSSFAGNIHVKINQKILKSAIKFGATIIVHTLRAKQQIDDFYNYKKVIVHPLQMVSDSFSPNSNTLQQLKQQLNFKSNDIIIGMFGYISSYKGHMDALEAMKIMNPRCKLLIFGRQHPQTIKNNGLVDEYLNSLMHHVKNCPELKNRVFFMGELEDHDFMSVAATIDVTWLPYYENGQDGSGIASICLELSPRVLCSSSFAFDELFKLIKYKNVLRFDIGNYIEMVQKTHLLVSQKMLSYPYSIDKTYTLQTQAKMYIEPLLKVEH